MTGDKLKLYFLIEKISGSYRAPATKVVTSACRRSFLCDVARRSQRSPMEAPVLPEPGLLHVRAWRASHSSRHRIELTSWCSILGRVGKMRLTDLDGEMANQRTWS